MIPDIQIAQRAIGNSWQLQRRSLLSLLLLVSCSTVSFAHDNEGAVPPDGRFTPNEVGAVFPPQPRAVENIRQFGMSSEAQQNGLTAAAAVARVEDVAVLLLADAEVAAELGQRFVHLSTADRQNKWDATQTWQEVMYFSYSLNQTVRVVYKNAAVDSIDIKAANIDQPALGESEKAEALALARAYWAEQSNTQIDTLTGYAIQTFQTDGSPYPTRMAYVSFHVTSPEPPVLANRVDLTTQQVVDSETTQ